MSTIPTPYDRQSSFTSFSTPEAPTVGPNLEAEFNAIETAMDATQSRLAEIQRDDGQLKNRVVSPDSLSQATLTLIGGWVARGEWATVTQYAEKDLVTESGTTYVCVAAHQSGTFAIDLANRLWLALASDTGTAPTAQDPLLFQDEGVDLAAAGEVVTIDFVGAGVSVTYSLGKATINVPGGSTNALTLNGQPDTYYRNASNLNAGTIPDGRFPAALPSINGANVTGLNASALGSGTVPDARFPATLPAVSGANLTNLNASNLGSGTLPSARFPATLPAVSGANLTNLNAGNLASGRVPYLRIPAEIRRQSMQIAVSDQTTAITTGTSKVTFRMPYNFTLTAVRASLNTASSSGVVTVDINEGGVSILSTKLTIDANEKTSTTAATAAVILNTALLDDAEITIDIDTAGTGANGLVVTLIGAQPDALA